MRRRPSVKSIETKHYEERDGAVPRPAQRSTAAPS